MTNDALIAALEKELAGYIRRGLADRAALVRKELDRLGCPTESPSIEVVPVEPVGTSQKPARRATKPAEASKKAAQPKTARTPKKAPK